MFKRELIVMPSDSSCLGTLKLHSLLNYFQDTASIAVSELEGTSTELVSRGYAWVLTKYEIEILKSLPSLDEKFFINTFHDPSHGFNTLRIFQVTNYEGNMIVWAKTSWLLLDLAAQRPVKPAVHLPEILEKDNENINPDFKEIPFFEDSEFIEINQHVRFHDIDNNSHVNNAVYFEWIFEATPLDLMKYELKSVYASFRSGIKFGDEVKIYIFKIPEEKNSFLYHVINKNNKSNKPSANFLCKWEERKEA